MTTPYFLLATFRVASVGSSGGIFDADFTHLFPDLPNSDKPETTLAMHQSPDATMYWIAGQEGMLLRVGVGRHSEGRCRTLDFAFSPMFNFNGYFYVSWTVDEPVSLYTIYYIVHD